MCLIDEGLMERREVGLGEYSRDDEAEGERFVDEDSVQER